MSWSASGRYEAEGDLDNMQTSPPELAAEPAAQHEKAKEAAQAVIDSGVVGDPPFSVSMSGHAKVTEYDGPKQSVSIGLSQTD